MISDVTSTGIRSPAGTALGASPIDHSGVSMDLFDLTGKVAVATGGNLPSG
jgi:hypothetical protein